MNFRGLDLNLLVALDAILTTRSITSAGTRMHLTQSAMSTALGRLREYFNDPLLVPLGGSNGGKKMVPTPLGESLIIPVRDILLQIYATVDASLQFDPRASSRMFRIMTTEYVATVLLSAALQRIRQLAPRLTFDILSNEIHSPPEALRRADIDLLIHPTVELADEHPWERLFDDDLACLIWTENSRVGNTLSFDEYLELGHVSARFKSNLPTLIDMTLDASHRTRSIEVTTTSFITVPQYVVGTDRICTVPRQLAELYSRTMPLKLLPLPIDLPSTTIALQWNRHFASDPSIVWVRNVIIGMAKEMFDNKEGS